MTKPTPDALKKYPDSLKKNEEAYIKPRNEFIEKTRKHIDVQAKEINLTGDGVDALDELIWALTVNNKDPNSDQYLASYMKVMSFYQIVKEYIPETTKDATKFFDRLHLLIDLGNDDEALAELGVDKQTVLDYADKLLTDKVDIVEHVKNYPTYKTASKYIGYCAKKLFIEMAKQGDKGKGTLKISSNEQVRYVYRLYQTFKYDYYPLSKDIVEDKFHKLQQFRNRAVPPEYK